MESEWILGRLAGRMLSGFKQAQDKGQWWAVVNTVMNLQVLVPWSELVAEISLCFYVA
jgi:hypothetical protein